VGLVSWLIAGCGLPWCITVVVVGGVVGCGGGWWFVEICIVVASILFCGQVF
jgi:hypothetical protein